jgi:hypothetical protein
MNELIGLAWMGAFALVLAWSYVNLNADNRFAVRLSAVRQAELLHNVRVNAFIFCIAGLFRGLLPIAAGAGAAWLLTFLFFPQATKVQAVQGRPSVWSEAGFYLAFVLVLPVRLAAISFSNGAVSMQLVVSAAICLVLAAVVLLLPSTLPLVLKMKGVLMPSHNVMCIAFLIVVTPVIGNAPFTEVHHLAGLVLLLVCVLRARTAPQRLHQLAFFLHWLLPLAGGRLPIALVLLGGVFSLKSAVILAVSVLVWGWAVGLHATRLEALQQDRDRMMRIVESNR